ncbi:PTS sugar transporter subunit IIA [Nanchangia anserum]|uniref:PTS sugar transporter subunit IIA n=1 Tax=Nanchangia anserum TaxID=2692125 RepID=A0A8I0KW73_9ACTO|nr:fructose-specific PTS transporter subunit EIIC [Nanchangia anserum]MBD3689709.1 PTS sugar transporter subunit IIA [Nanchangia anserum]QOX81883.1 PTS sugar transporter subunit IIA [Nanchangia anserum]
MSDAPLITTDLVSLDHPLGENKRDVIAALARRVAATGRAEANGLIASLGEREAQGATGFPGGFAIPHARSRAVTTAALGFARLPKPVDFGAKDGPADLVFLIAAPDGAGDMHLKLLQRLARGLARPDFVASLRAAGSAEEVVDLIMAQVEKKKPATASAPSAPAATETTSAPTCALVAVTSCPTGIAHTYMAAENLENAAREAGVTIAVEPQGSGGIDFLDPEVIKAADAVIFAHDVEVRDKHRFAGLPVVDVGVKRAVDDAPALIDRAIRAAKDPQASRVSAESSSSEGGSNEQVSMAKRIQQVLMTGVSYMIPFVAAGGLLTALAFVIGGYDVAFKAQDIVLTHSFWDLPGTVTLDSGEAMSRSGLALYIGALLATLGSVAMGFLVAALSGYIAFGLAGRPGLAPGFVGGAISVLTGAGFIGGLVTGLVAGVIAMWLASFRPPRWLAGLMPVVIIPLVATFITGGLMLAFLGRPLAALMEALQSGLSSMSGGSAVVLGIILGLMMCFDLGGPVNKAAYLFATAGLAEGSPTSTGPYLVMAAVMASGMVPPLAMALSTVIRKKYYSKAERENGKTAWLLGASFISEGAIPFAAADPLRVIPSMMLGGAVTGALSMAFGVNLRAPHGGIFVILAITPWWGFLISIVAGVLVGACAVTIAKGLHYRKLQANADTVSVTG